MVLDEDLAEVVRFAYVGIVFGADVARGVRDEPAGQDLVGGLAGLARATEHLDGDGAAFILGDCILGLGRTASRAGVRAGREERKGCR